MSSRTCHHILASGAQCHAEPLRNRDYCRFHLDQIGRRMRAARSRARHQRPMLKLPLLEDLYAVQIAIMELGDALTDREIEPQYARLLTTVLRLAMQNLKNCQSWEERSQHFHLAETAESASTTWDTFEQEYDLPSDLDLSLDPQVAFPPPPKEEPLPVPESLPRSGPAVRELPLSADLGVAGAHYIPHQGVCDREGKPIEPSDCVEAGPKVPCRVTADQVEIADVLDREGKEAMYKVIAQQERNRKRRERHIRRLYYEEAARNHSIKLSAERLADERHKAEAEVARAAAPPAPKSAADEAYDAITRQLAEVNRKPPHSQAVAQEQKAAAGEP
jgi:hypothetical protein